MSDHAERALRRDRQVSPREDIPAGGRPRPRVDLASRLDRARLYADAAAPSDVHRLLEFLLDEPPARDSEAGGVSGLVLLAGACRALGHAEHLERIGRRLEAALAAGAPGLSVEARLRATFELASQRQHAERYREGLELLRGVAPADLERTPPRLAVALLGMEAQCLARLGRYEEAEAAIARSLPWAEASGEPALAGDVRTRMASVLRMRGRLRQAMELFRQASVLHRNGGDYRGTVIDLIQQGGILNRLGMPSESRDAYARASRQAAGIGEAWLQLNADIGVAMTAIRLGVLEEARPALLRCWREARRQGLLREETLALEFLGEANALAGRPVPARTALALCRRRWERTAPQGDLAAEGGIREALLWLTQAEWERADAAAAEAVEATRRCGLPWEEAQALRLQGIARAESGDLEGARASFGDALRALEITGDRLEIALVQEWLRWLRRPAGVSKPSIHPGARRPFGQDWGQAGRPGRPGKLQPPELSDSLELSDSPELSDSLELSDSPELPDPPELSDLPELPDPSDLPEHPEPAAAHWPAARRALGSKVPRPGRAAAPGPDAGAVWARLGLVTRSAAVLGQLEHAASLARTGDTVLILGETGTGKDVVARGVHELSGRTGRLVPLNCAACPTDLVESELFGVERGAFTGADRRRAGLALEAENGTLFLDEIGDLPPRAQGAVLRFLDSGEVRSLGSSVIRRVRVGLVAATQEPLAEAVRSGRFRRDLYFRIAQGVIHLPPLRERLEDLEVLIPELWRRVTADADAPRWLLGERALQAFRAHAWPGNIRELEHLLRRLRADRTWRGGDLQAGLDGIRRALGAAPLTPGPIQTATNREAVLEVLRSTRGNRTAAAERLGISRSTLYRILRGKAGRIPPSPLP